MADETDSESTTEVVLGNVTLEKVNHKMDDYRRLVSVDFGTYGCVVAHCAPNAPKETSEIMDLGSHNDTKKTLSAILLRKDPPHELLAFGDEASEVYLTHFKRRTTTTTTKTTSSSSSSVTESVTSTESTTKKKKKPTSMSDRWSELTADDVVYFEHFKPELYHDGAYKDVKVTAKDGQTQLCLSVLISASLKYISDFVLSRLNEAERRMHGDTARMDLSDVLWVITVPAIWDEMAMETMKLCAHRAGMLRFVMAKEPVAATFGMMPDDDDLRKAVQTHLNRFLVLDCGGGTIDATAIKVIRTEKKSAMMSKSELTSSSKSLSEEEKNDDDKDDDEDDFVFREVHHNTGQFNGGMRVDELFEFVCELIFGKDYIDAIRRDSPREWISQMKEFKQQRCLQKGNRSSDEYSIPFMCQALSKSLRKKSGDKDRAKQVKKRIKQLNIQLSRFGMARLVDPDVKIAEEEEDEKDEGKTKDGDEFLESLVSDSESYLSSLSMIEKYQGIWLWNQEKMNDDGSISLPSSESTMMVTNPYHLLYYDNELEFKKQRIEKIKKRVMESEEFSDELKHRVCDMMSEDEILANAYELSGGKKTEYFSLKQESYNAKLQISHDGWRFLHYHTCKNISLFLKDLRSKTGMKKIILVGGFSNSDFLVKQLEMDHKMKFLRAKEPHLAVVKGALHWVCKERRLRKHKARLTYGVATTREFNPDFDTDEQRDPHQPHLVRNAFRQLIVKDQQYEEGTCSTFKFGVPREFYTRYSAAAAAASAVGAADGYGSMSEILVDIFATDREPESVRYVTEEGCVKVKSFRIPVGSEYISIGPSSSDSDGGMDESSDKQPTLSLDLKYFDAGLQLVCTESATGREHRMAIAHPSVHELAALT